MKKMMLSLALLLLMMPAFAMAGAIPDTAGGLDSASKDIALKCYDAEGNSITCPTVCSNKDASGNSIPCSRTFYDSASKAITYYEAANKQIFFLGKRRCFNESGEEEKCPSLDCYDKAAAGTKLSSWPTKCYSEKTATTVVACPPQEASLSDFSIRGKGTDDFYGQDSNYKINAPSYLKLDSAGKEVGLTSTSWAMVKDNITGLIWAVKDTSNGTANLSNPHDADNAYKWDEVKNLFLNKLNDATAPFGSVTDWRLPTDQELNGIVNADGRNPAIRSDFFPNMQKKYWTSTEYAKATRAATQAWYVDFSQGGKIAPALKTEALYVIAVRGKSASVSGRFTDNGDGTVSDSSTGLMWTKANASTKDQDWEGAILACEASKIGGKEDWRLGNRAELFSIMDLSKNAPAMDATVFTSPSAKYWSSTTYDDGDASKKDASAWSVETVDGMAAYDLKTATASVRCVRGGQNEIGGDNKATTSLVVTTPTLASSWANASLMPIIWKTSASVKSDVKISLSCTVDDKTTEQVIAAGTPSDGTYLWTVSGPASDECYLTIASTASAESAYTAVQGPFAIQSGSAAGGCNDLPCIIHGLQVLTAQ